MTNISNNGFSFKCMKRPYFLQDWFVDIFDVSGMKLENFQVEKVWEKLMSDLDESSPFPVEFGVEFKSLTPQQRLQLDIYIKKLKDAEDKS